MIRKLLLISLGASLATAGLASAQFSPSSLPTVLPPLPEASASPVAAGALPLESALVIEEAPRFNLRADYLLWTIKSPQTPPLLTTSAAPADRATLGMPTTGIVSGGDTRLGTFSGGRLFANYQLGDVWGVQVGGFMLEQKSRTFGIRSNAGGTPTIGVPFQSAFDGSQQANLLASPASLAGGASTRYTSHLWGAEANATALAVDSDGVRLRLLGGFRNADLREQLRLDTASTLIGTPGVFDGMLVGQGTSFTAFDQFGTRNSFYGGQVGLQAAVERGVFSLSAFGKVALGVSHELAAINGATTAAMPDGTVATAPGGTFAQTSNIGRLSTDRFAVLPEVGFNLGLNVTDRITVFAGYQFLYWSDVVRPGDQVNQVVNSNLIPTQSDGTRLGPQLPSAALRHTDFWAQGVNFGMNFSW
jgi:hypothetical protein